MVMKREDKVLIVADNPLFASAIERAGIQLEMTADHAIDGWDAISKLETEDYVTIVIDTDVPHHSGFGVLTYLREEIGDELGNVIVMTSSDCGELARRYDDRVHVIARTDEVSTLADAMRLARR
jgi:DNA-binding response OmpR family regulator